MQLYLPVAEVSVNLFALVGIGSGVGFLSGLFGVGGGFLLTPLLIFFGVPAPFAVATGANQVVGSSFSAMTMHWRRGTVDAQMGLVLVAGGIVGATFGVLLFSLIRELGQIDLIVALSYIVLLGTVGGLMLVDAIRSALARKTKKPPPPRRKVAAEDKARGLPFRMQFERSNLEMSLIPLLGFGAAIGLIAGFLGIGGGFILVPAMIYFLKVPTGTVIGTSLFQIVVVSAYSTVMHAVTNGTVDVLLAAVLLLGGTIGAQFGAMASIRLRGGQLRFLLALMILAVAVKLAADLVIEPAQLYSVEIAR